MKVSLVEVLIVLTIILLFVGGIGAALLMPNFEKDAFNKFRDPNEPKATYWDAADPNYNLKKDMEKLIDEIDEGKFRDYEERYKRGELQ